MRDDRDIYTNVFLSEPRFRFFRHVNRTTALGTVERAGQRQLRRSR